ncbi:RNA polymerase sigma factor [Undibacterium macrobrachii]|uniref:RNA polymerase sigma factor n=1 Tax=Undibacterium macrobrachii TaxID=1119058 RepID=A0ABQ2XIS9_9BURK|nr:sigma-70 family RNA polymerase sigma factor [Undibacterium macrobrachii]GGX18277.1 RNA polymerase sigma factor [Undibacterium macrobrachii]
MPSLHTQNLASDPAHLHLCLVAVAKQDAKAFKALYEASSAKLFSFVLRILQNRELAEEVLQESFVNIWNNADSYQSSLASPMTWMTTIVRNRAFDLLRKLNNGQHLTVSYDTDQFETEVWRTMESQDTTPVEALELSQDAASLARCMTKLEGLHRQAMSLAYFHDLSHSEVAEQMELPIGTIKTWIRRGLEKLRLCLNTNNTTQIGSIGVGAKL